MSLLACCRWWFVLGALAGWLLSWLVNRLIGRTGVQEIPAQAPPAPVVAAATTSSRVDDLVVIEGVGPKIAELLCRHGIPPAWSGNVLPRGRSKSRGSPNLG